MEALVLRTTLAGEPPTPPSHTAEERQDQLLTVAAGHEEPAQDPGECERVHHQSHQSHVSAFGGDTVECPAPTQEQTVQAQVQGLTVLSQGLTVLSQGQTVPTQGQTVPTQGQTVPTQEQTVPTQGQIILTQGLTFPGTIPPQGQTVPTHGQTVPTQGQTVPTQGQTVPPQGQIILTRGEAIQPPTPPQGQVFQVPVIQTQPPFATFLCQLPQGYVLHPAYQGQAHQSMPTASFVYQVLPPPPTTTNADQSTVGAQHHTQQQQPQPFFFHPSGSLPGVPGVIQGGPYPQYHAIVGGWPAAAPPQATPMATTSQSAPPGQGASFSTTMPREPLSGRFALPHYSRGAYAPLPGAGRPGYHR